MGAAGGAPLERSQHLARRANVKELKNLANDPVKRKPVIADCVDLINAEVKSKGGLSGMAVKAAFAVVKALKPHILEESVENLLDEFVEAMQPLYSTFQEEGSVGTLEAYLPRHAESMADALLAITDRRAERAKNKTLANAYFKLRPKGKIHVGQAAPGIGRVLDKHVGSL
jgi:hypothetical protein